MSLRQRQAIEEMTLEYKFQLDETTMGARAGWVTYKTGVERMGRDEGPRKTGTWDQRTAFAGVLVLPNHTYRYLQAKLHVFGE